MFVTRGLVTLSLLLYLVSTLHAGPVTQVQSGTEDTWHNGTATLASGSNVLSGNVTLTNPGHLQAYCTLHIPDFSGVPAANTAVQVWFRVSTDGGTTFPDGDATDTPAALPNLTFPLRAADAVQRISARVDQMPLGVFRVLIRNDGTGVTLNTTWSLKCKTHTLTVN